jgi:hypothetical protein
VLKGNPDRRTLLEVQEHFGLPLLAFQPPALEVIRIEAVVVSSSWSASILLACIFPGNYACTVLLKLGPIVLKEWLLAVPHSN